MTAIPDLIDTQQIAKLLGVTRAHCVNRIVKRPDFPAPAVNISQRLRRWRRADVLKWIGAK